MNTLQACDRSSFVSLAFMATLSYSAPLPCKAWPLPREAQHQLLISREPRSSEATARDGHVRQAIDGIRLEGLSCHELRSLRSVKINAGCEEKDKEQKQLYKNNIYILTMPREAMAVITVAHKRYQLIQCRPKCLIQFSIFYNDLKFIYSSLHSKWDHLSLCVQPSLATFLAKFSWHWQT